MDCPSATTDKNSASCWRWTGHLLVQVKSICPDPPSLTLPQPEVSLLPLVQQCCRLPGHARNRCSSRPGCSRTCSWGVTLHGENTAIASASAPAFGPVAGHAGVQAKNQERVRGRHVSWPQPTFEFELASYFGSGAGFSAFPLRTAAEPESLISSTACSPISISRPLFPTTITPIKRFQHSRSLTPVSLSVIATMSALLSAYITCL